MKDEKGYPEYYGGRIYDHSHHRYIDMMTGLHNQNSFFEDVRNKIINKKEVRLAIVGIGKFTEINAVHGYSFGNRVLQSVGRYLIDYIGTKSSVYRLDGTKFAVITDNYSLDTDTQTVYTCLNFAYIESKNAQYGDLVEFRNDSRKDERLRLAKIHEIRNSITKAYKGFYLLYQPIVNADTEEVIGAEALLRWKNETYGVVAPDEFIPILESDQLFVDLGDWILRTALETAKKILCKKPDFVINVNLSYVQIAQADFTDKVWNVLKETGFPAKNLCLEITERCRLLDVNLLRNVIVSLRAGGIRVALDDFGTGYSSVGLIKNLPFDTIKIDRSFVLKIEEDEKERELVNNLASSASFFGAKACVEGIETSGMRDILRNYGIYSFQGYYYSKPIMGDELISKYFSDNNENA